MEKLKIWVAKQPIKTALLRLILIGTIISAFLILLFLILWNFLLNSFYQYIATKWFIGGVSLYIGGMIVGSFVILYVVMMITAHFFYQVKLQSPLTQLRFGVTKIQKQDLDFSLKSTSNDELGSLVQAFEAMRQELRDALQTAWRLADDQKQVNAAFAHDLRTPMTVLQGNVELLELQEGQLDTETLKDMKHQLDRINTFIETMSHLSSIQNIHLNPSHVTPTHLDKILRDEVDQLTDHKTIRWTVKTFIQPDSKPILSMATVLEIFDNQITNAFRFAKSKVVINLTIKKDHFEMTVFNDGQQLSSSELSNAKLPYFSPHRAGRHFGVGMYICDQLCQAHHGHFTIQNCDDGNGVHTKAFLNYLD